MKINEEEFIYQLQRNLVRICFERGCKMILLRAMGEYLVESTQLVKLLLVQEIQPLVTKCILEIL